MKLDTPMLFAATTNSKASRKFYEEALGLEFVSEDQFALVFLTGKVQLRIQKVQTKPKIGYTVIGWAVTDIKAMVQHLAKNGVTFMRFDGLGQDADGIWQAPGGAFVAWFADPDKNTISLTQHP